MVELSWLDYVTVVGSYYGSHSQSWIVVPFNKYWSYNMSIADNKQRTTESKKKAAIEQ